MAVGPEPYRPKSFWPEWNYTAELYAFEQRIGEKFDRELLTCALVDKDAYPRLPEEWISVVVDKLMSGDELSHVGSHIGIKDIMIYSTKSQTAAIDAPPSLEMISAALFAITGSLAASQDVQRAELFTRDFILTRLEAIDLLGDVFVIDNPINLLSGILRVQQRGDPVPRLQQSTGMNTMLACYQVGMYSDKEQIGEGTGETPEIAEAEAAADAVRKLFGLTEDRPPLNLTGTFVPLPPTTDQPNPSISLYLNESIPRQYHR